MKLSRFFLRVEYEYESLENGNESSEGKIRVDFCMIFMWIQIWMIQRVFNEILSRADYYTEVSQGLSILFSPYLMLMLL